MRTVALGLALALGVPRSVFGFESDEHVVVAAGAKDVVCREQRAPSSASPIAAELRALLCDETRALVKCAAGFTCTFAAISGTVHEMQDEPEGLFLARESAERRFRSHRHYYPQNAREYGRFHRTALQLVVYAKHAMGVERADLLAQALVFEAFAAHYLADRFSPTLARLGTPDHVHFAVRVRNQLRTRGQGTSAEDGRYYFGDGGLADHPDQRHDIVVALATSLRALMHEADGHAVAPNGAVTALPVFAWPHAEETRILDRSETELVELAVVVPPFGPRVSFDLHQHLRAFAEATMTSVRAGGGAGLKDAWRVAGGLGLRVPLVQSEARGDIDFAVDLSWSCWHADAWSCRRAPAMAAGIDIYLPLEHGVAAVVGARMISIRGYTAAGDTTTPQFLIGLAY